MAVQDHAVPIEGLYPDEEELATYFAKIITSKHNQHAIIMIVGAAGKGKSWAAVYLAREVAKKVSEILGEGTPDDYFNFNDTFATITKDEVKRVMNKPKKYTILLLDDVAAKALNARNFRDSDNIDLNAELQTFRPNHNLVIMTAQAGFLLDKVPRSISHFIIEMDMALFDIGITIGKVKQVVYQHGSGKLIFPYLQCENGKYVRHIFYSPPADVMREYERIRELQLQRSAEKKEDDQNKETKISKKDYLVGVVDGIIAEFNVSQGKACKIVGCSSRYYRELKAGGGTNC